MSTTKTLKLLNSITTTTSATKRRNSAVTTAASSFVPMFQSNMQNSFFPHCPGPQQQQQQQQLSGSSSGQQYHHQFIPTFVTPTTPASSDHYTLYHGTNVTSPPPYYFHTPPISSIGGAGGAAAAGSANNNVNASHQSKSGGQGQQPLLHHSSSAGVLNNGRPPVVGTTTCAVSPTIATTAPGTDHNGNYLYSGSGMGISGSNHAATGAGHSHHTRNLSLQQHVLAQQQYLPQQQQHLQQQYQYQSNSHHHHHHQQQLQLQQQQLDAFNKKAAGLRSSISHSQFSVASSPHFQFAFDPKLAQNNTTSINTSENQNIAPLNNSTVNPLFLNLTSPVSRPGTGTGTAGHSSHHSRQSSLHQVQTLAPEPANSQQQPTQQQQPQPDVAVPESQPSFGFSFLPLNPEPILPVTAAATNSHINNNNPYTAAVQPTIIPQLKPPSQGLLPGGFFSLTPEDPYPCISPLASTPLQNSQPCNPFFSIMPLNPVVQQVAPRVTYPTGYMRPQHQRLTRTAVASVDSRDSREFRWNRVLRYVQDISAMQGATFPPSEGWIRQQRHRVLLGPRDNMAADKQSLWDGGSLGTNGVDDFIWDDDLQNGKRFTIPPRSQQGDAPHEREEENLMFTLEPSKTEFDLAFGYEVDDAGFHPPAKRSKSNESQKAARKGLHEYLNALKSVNLTHAQDMKREAPLTMA